MALSKKQALELVKENAERYSREEMRASLIAEGLEPKEADALIAEALADKAWLRQRTLKRISLSFCAIAVVAIAAAAYRLKRADRADLLTEARAAARLNDHARALRLFDGHIQVHPGDGYAYLNRGTSRLELGDHDGALADFKQALFLEPRNAAALSGLILAYGRRGAQRTLEKDYSGALEDYEKILALDPADTLAANGKDICLGLLGRRDTPAQPATSRTAPIILK